MAALVDCCSCGTVSAELMCVIITLAFMFCVGNQWELCTQWELVMFVSQDCNWGDHCARVSAKYGVVSQKTPSGLQWKEFVQAMAKFDRKARKNDD